MDNNESENKEQARNEQIGGLAGMGAGMMAGARVGTEAGKRIGPALINAGTAFLQTMSTPSSGAGGSTPSGEVTVTEL